MFYKGQNLGPGTITRGTSVDFSFEFFFGIIFYFSMVLGKIACNPQP